MSSRPADLVQHHAPSDSRLGGVLTVAWFNSSITHDEFALLSDENTVLALIPRYRKVCAAHLTATTTSDVAAAIVYTEALSSSIPPESAVIYYRGSSATLLLKGYNNTAVFVGQGNGPATPLPSQTDTDLLGCLKSTTASSIPLIGAGHSITRRGNAGAWGHALTLVATLVSLKLFVV